MYRTEMASLAQARLWDLKEIDSSIREYLKLKVSEVDTPVFVKDVRTEVKNSLFHTLEQVERESVAWVASVMRRDSTGNDIEKLDRTLSGYLTDRGIIEEAKKIIG